MNPADVSPASDDHAHYLRRVVTVGLILLALLSVESQLLPWLEGASEPALAGAGPWKWVHLLGADRWQAPPSLPIAISLLCLGGMSVAYLRAIAAAGRLDDRGLLLPLLFGLTTVLLTAAILAPPLRKADAFYYAFQGRMIVRAGLDPYLSPPRVLDGDPWFPLVSPVWRDLTTGYGPAWLLISAGLDLLLDHGMTASDLTALVLALRALFAASILASVILLWQILGILAPDRRFRATLIFAWNPAVLVVGVEHNDAVMLMLALAALLLQLRGRRFLAVSALTLSAMIKYYTLPLLGVHLLWQTHDAGRPLRIRLLLPAVCLMEIVLLVAPFDPRSVIVHYPAYLVASGRLDHISQLPFELVAALGVVVVLRLARLSRPEQLLLVVENGALALMIYLAFLSRDWFPWYLVTAIGLTAILGGNWLTCASVAGVFWLLDLHQGAAYLAALAQTAFLLPPFKTLEIITLAPPTVAMIVGWLERRLTRWRPPSGLAVVAIVVATVFLQLPLLARWPNPPVVDLNGRRQPGAVVVGTTLEWDDWSWGARVQQVGTPAGPAGPRSLCVQPLTDGGAFYAHHSGFATRGYHDLTIDLGADDATLSALRLEVRGATGQTLGAVALDRYRDRARPLAGAWRQITIPLGDLGASDTTVTGVIIQFGAPPNGAARCFQDLAFRQG